MPRRGVLRGNPADQAQAGFDRDPAEPHPPPSLPFEEVRADIGLPLDRIVVAEHAVGDERVARADIVLAELDRVQAQNCGALATVPFERRRARRLLASRDRIGEHIAFDESFQGADLSRQPPVDIKGRAEAGGEQDNKRDCDPLKRHVSPKINANNNFLFEHDLRANALRLSRGKTGTHFSGSYFKKASPSALTVSRSRDSRHYRRTCRLRKSPLKWPWS